MQLFRSEMDYTEIGKVQLKPDPLLAVLSSHLINPAPKLGGNNSKIHNKKGTRNRRDKTLLFPEDIFL